MNVCMQCQKPIRLLKRGTKYAPIDFTPSESGNIRVKGDTYSYADKFDKELAKQRHEPLYTHHYDTCGARKTRFELELQEQAWQRAMEQVDLKVRAERREIEKLGQTAWRQTPAPFWNRRDMGSHYE